MSIAKAVVAGNLVRDPEIKYLQNGNAIANFSIAVNDGWGDKPHTSFLDCVAFGKQAESLCQYKAKGDMILVDGTMEQQQWKNKEGENRSKVVVKAFHIDFLGRSEKRDEEGKADGAESTFPPKGSGATNQEVDPETGENLPF